ncbi:MAG: hypothetical protein ABI557_01420 [Aureliella sp.]
MDFLAILRAGLEQHHGEVTDANFVTCNFPFVSCQSSRVGHRRQVSLPMASLNNGWQYLQSGRSSYRRLALRHWEPLLNSTEQLLLVTGSCGLQLALEGLQVTSAELDRVQVLALGPVANQARARSSMHLLTIQGERDWLSRHFFSADVLVPGVGHLEYWSNECVHKVATDWVLNKISVS